jgi:hypothetical protein
MPETEKSGDMAVEKPDKACKTGCCGGEGPVRPASLSIPSSQRVDKAEPSKTGCCDDKVSIDSGIEKDGQPCKTGCCGDAASLHSTSTGSQSMYCDESQKCDGEYCPYQEEAL